MAVNAPPTATPVRRGTVRANRPMGEGERLRMLRAAPFAVRVVRREGNLTAIVYRRTLNGRRLDRLARLTTIGPTAFASATPLLRAAVQSAGQGARLDPGPYLPLDAAWGARVACLGFIAAGLRDASRLILTARRLRDADPSEAAWWLGQMAAPSGIRAVRALRILLEAVP